MKIDKVGTSYLKWKAVSIEHKTGTIYRNNKDWYSKPLPKIVWNTVVERLTQFLSYYWHEYMVRENALSNMGIKEEVAVCIAWADSWLWHALKSSYNYGNVWNNDRGDVIHYKSPTEWISAIGRVLNNRYLGYKQTVGSLSPWWWWTRPYYATSESTRNANVLNCLTLIYNKRIDESFIIRM